MTETAPSLAQQFRSDLRSSHEINWYLPPRRTACALFHSLSRKCLSETRRNDRNRPFAGATVQIGIEIIPRDKLVSAAASDGVRLVPFVIEKMLKRDEKK